MRAHAYAASTMAAYRIDAVQMGDVVRSGASAAIIDDSLRMSTAGLESYFFADWDPVLIDLIVVAATVEFCDVVHRRPAWGWARRYDVTVAVHVPELWNEPSVLDALTDAVSFLTGDYWTFSFVQRRIPANRVKQQTFDLGSSVRVVMPYSDGLDSRAVAALVADREGSDLVRVRLGTNGAHQAIEVRRRRPFAAVPYTVRVPKSERRESSARSRGFKFAVVTGVAAHLARVSRIIVTESGQGALGPVLTVTGHAYPDYRVHPAFSRRMERLLMALLGRSARYQYPRLWFTKGETLAAAVALPSGLDWTDTRSCWQQSRQVAIDGQRRQCGICAACLLRRMSMYRAGLLESDTTYACVDLTAPTMRQSAAQGFSGFTPALEEYGVAGVLHLDHLAALAGSRLHAQSKRRIAREVAAAEDLDERVVERNQEELLHRHHDEWRAFLATLGPRSFVMQLASVSP